MSDVLERWRDEVATIHLGPATRAAALVKAGDALAARVVELERVAREVKQQYHDRRDALIETIRRAEEAELRAATFQRALEEIDALAADGQTTRDIEDLIGIYSSIRDEVSEAATKPHVPVEVELPAGPPLEDLKVDVTVPTPLPRPCTWQRLAQDQQVLEDCPEMALPGSDRCAKHQEEA